MPPTGPLYAGTATNVTITGNNWTPLTNGTGPPDGNFVTAGMPGGGSSTDAINLTNFGFSIPSTAVIDGIVVDFDREGSNAGTSYIQILKAGSTAGTLKVGTDIWPVSVPAFVTYGGTTDLWGAAWTASDINNSGFGIQLQAFNTHGGGSASLDALRITVYWHTAPADVPKRYLYKVFNSGGTYLGNLPNVSSIFGYSQDINTTGAQITVECAVSADTASLPADNLTDEAGNLLTDESLNQLTNEGQIPIVAPGNATYDAIIKNGNKVVVYEYSFYWPNGKPMFSGQIKRNESDYGGDNDPDTITVLLYSDGSDLDNYIIRGFPFTYTTDVSQTSQNTRDSIISTTGKLDSWNFDGQTWVVGAGVTNLAAITVMLDGTADVTISVYDSPALSNFYGSVTQSVSVVGPTAVQFGFPTLIPVTAGNSYFFTVTVGANQSIWLQFSNSNPYAGGQMYNSFFGGGSGGGSWTPITGSDLYFQTFSGVGSTTATFTSLDPSTGTLEAFMNDYLSRGGNIGYTTNSVDATGLSLTLGFNTNTIYEGIKTALSVSPDGFYYYVDLGTDTLYFKNQNSVADVVLTKGRHLTSVKMVNTIENVINQVNFTGGPTSGVNLYKQYQSTASIARYGVLLDRKSDNRVTVSATADAIGVSEIAELKDEQNQTVITVLDKTMDITLLKPGLIVGFNGFGTFVDNLLLQIVRVDYTPYYATLTLGILPKRLNTAFEEITRGLVASQTLANPSAPS